MWTLPSCARRVICARSLLAPESRREYPARTSLVSPLHTGVVSRHARATLRLGLGLGLGLHITLGFTTGAIVAGANVVHSFSQDSKIQHESRVNTPLYHNTSTS